MMNGGVRCDEMIAIGACSVDQVGLRTQHNAGRLCLSSMTALGVVVVWRIVQRSRSGNETRKVGRASQPETRLRAYCDDTRWRWLDSLGRIALRLDSYFPYIIHDKNCCTERVFHQSLLPLMHFIATFLNVGIARYHRWPDRRRVQQLVV
jgi:hypothetical protein